MPRGGGAGGKGDPGEEAQWSDGAGAGEAGGEEESGGPLRPKSRAGHRGAPGGTPCTRSSPALLRVPLCGGTPHMHPSALLQEKCRGTLGGGKGGAKADSEGRQVCSLLGGEPGSHWPPVDTSGQGHTESFLTITKHSFFSLEQESMKSRVPGVHPGAELKDSS